MKVNRPIYEILQILSFSLLDKTPIREIPFQVLNSINKIAIQYPAILKPSDAQGQRGIFLVSSQAEFESHFQDALKYSREAVSYTHLYFTRYYKYTDRDC